ncbi:MAG: DUF3307 domain-containing protein [Bacteroidetes bacterium]|nr:DUF3307 domain-containing protein [Bacteroidota bacterium]
MGAESILILLFVTKHLIFDWWLQPAWMAFEKHDMRKKGGYVHAGLNVVGSVLAIYTFPFVAIVVFGLELPTSTIPLAVIGLLLLGEFVSHYLMDFTKMNVSRKMGWKCNEHQAFWNWTGFDQWFHMMYLVFMAGMIA